MEHNSKKDLIVTLAVLLVVVLAIGGAVAFAKKKSSNSTDTNTVQTTQASNDTSTSTASNTPASNASSTFKDGTYSATGEYATPDGPETITVKVTLKSGSISDTSATASMQSRESKDYAAQFLDAYKTFVVGKDISAVKLSRVSGSSLTSQGFNSAIQQIQTQAKA
jgi:uncharacterized protein with FMN-binding domain